MRRFRVMREFVVNGDVVGVGHGLLLVSLVDGGEMVESRGAYEFIVDLDAAQDDSEPFGAD